jgi:pimeloyl-ACP methyl ester carboxylesterase
MTSTYRGIRPLQIAAHPHNNSLVVLIHGILSSRYSAWEYVIDMIQTVYDESAGSATFGSYDYYAFGYDSGFRQPKLEEFFDSLRNLVSLPRYDTVVLIGHSQGGIVAKLFLIEEMLNGRGQSLNVDIVITLDSPHRGPQPWIYPIVVAGGIWKYIPILNAVPLFRQAADLGFGSNNLKKVRKNWNETLFSEAPCAPQANRRHLRSYTVSGTRLPFPRVKLVVSERSADGFEMDQPLQIPAAERTAWGLGHGVAAMGPYRHQIERILSEHDQARVASINEATAAMPRGVLEHILAPSCEAASLPCEVQCWRRRLVEGFRHRPLRGLAFDEAVEKFVQLRQQHP